VLRSLPIHVAPSTEEAHNTFSLVGHNIDISIYPTQPTTQQVHVPVLTMSVCV
jgi:hypothetical protein